MAIVFVYASGGRCVVCFLIVLHQKFIFSLLCHLAAGGLYNNNNSSCLCVFASLRLCVFALKTPVLRNTSAAGGIYNNILCYLLCVSMVPAPDTPKHKKQTSSRLNSNKNFRVFVLPEG
jgi:hypothetical protein